MAVRSLCAWEALPSEQDKPRHLQPFFALKINSSVVEGGRQTKYRWFGVEVAGTTLSRDVFFSSDLMMPSRGVGGKHRSENNFALDSYIPPSLYFPTSHKSSSVGIQTFCFCPNFLFFLILFVCLLNYCSVEHFETATVSSLSGKNKQTLKCWDSPWSKNLTSRWERSVP